jgi:APA family basic amino acid/polyamine antiporter
MTAPNRPLGIYSATSLVVASMIGAGVYTTSGFALADLGSRWVVLASWGVAGLVALCGALCYGAMARAITESGGEYVFLSRAVHPLAGFLAGWISLLAGFTGATAFAATALESYCRPVLATDLPLPPGTIAGGAIVFCVALHAFHVRVGDRFQNVIVTAKLLGLIAFVGYATWRLAQVPIASDNPPAATWTWLALANTLTWISLSYSGFNAAVYVTDEVQSAEQTVPRAMFWATAVVTLIYIAINAIVLWSGPTSELAGEADVVAKAAALTGGANFAAATRALVAVSLFTSISAMIMSGPRVYAKMSADGLFPVPLPKTDRAMMAAVVLQGGLAIVVVLVSNLQGLLDYLGFMLSVSAAATVALTFHWANRAGNNFKRPIGYPLTPIFYVAATLLFAAMTAYRKPWECAIASGVTVVSGLMLYWVMVGLGNRNRG